MELLDQLLASADKLGAVPSWITLALLLRVRSDVKKIKVRLGIVERRAQRRALPPLPPIPRTA